MELVQEDLSFTCCPFFDAGDAAVVVTVAWNAWYGWIKAKGIARSNDATKVQAAPKKQRIRIILAA